MKHKKLLSIFLFFFSLALSIGFFSLKDYFKDWMSLGLLGIFLINFASSSTFFVSGPAFLTVIAGGSLYPPLLVALIASMGTAFGDMIAFVLGYSGRHLTEHKLKKKLWFVVLEDLFKIHGSILVFVVALIPNPLFDAVGLIAGIFGFEPIKFFILTFLGRFTRFVILAFIGANYY